MALLQNLRTRLNNAFSPPPAADLLESDTYNNTKTAPAEGSSVDKMPYVAAPKAATDAIDVAKMARNPYLRARVDARIAEVFTAPPEITVYAPDYDSGVDDTPEPSLTAALRKIAVDVDLYRSMRRAYRDVLYYGAAVRSVAYVVGDPMIEPPEEAIERLVNSFRSEEEEKPKEANLVRIAEIRDLPASSFSASMEAMNIIVTRHITPNPLMRGLIVTADERDSSRPYLHVFQRDPLDANLLIPKELENVMVIIHPDAPAPCGEALCAPVYSVVKSIDLVEAALDRQTGRTGVPLIVPKISDDASPGSEPKLIKYARELADGWGDITMLTLPKGMELADPKIHESPYTQERLQSLVGVLDAFFSPSSVLRQSGDNAQLIGGSDEGKAELYRSFIASEQQWICAAYAKILHGCLVRSGYGEYRVVIELPRPERDLSEKIIQQLQLAAAGTTGSSSISDSELRERLDLLDLPAELPPEIEKRREEEKQQQNLFGGFGNNEDDSETLTNSYQYPRSPAVAFAEKMQETHAKFWGK